MYAPAQFAESDLAALHEFIEQHPFGMLVSNQGRAPFVTHLPFLLDRASGTHGTLIGHVARQNPQWEQLADQLALAVFHGPHAYVSPTWYEADKVVPTWNYVAVHAYGRPTVITEPDELVRLVGGLTDASERHMPVPWKVDGEASFVRKLSEQIVGFRIELERIEGKWKLNQNHTEERRRKVIMRLREQRGDDAQEIADLMERTLTG